MKYGVVLFLFLCLNEFKVPCVSASLLQLGSSKDTCYCRPNNVLQHQVQNCNHLFPLFSCYIVLSTVFVFSNTNYLMPFATCSLKNNLVKLLLSSQFWWWQVNFQHTCDLPSSCLPPLSCTQTPQSCLNTVNRFHRPKCTLLSVFTMPGPVPQSSL